MRTRLWPIFAAVVCLAVIDLGPTSTAFGQDRGSLPTWGRSLSPAESRELQGRVDRLSIQLNIRNETIAAIARQLGRRSDISFDELIDAVTARAQEAAQLRAQIVELSELVADLAGGNTGELVAALDRAQRAFDAGNLDEAERELAPLDRLRGLQAAGSNDVWIRVVSIRARIAALSGSGLRGLSVLDSAQAQVDRATWAIQFERGLILADMARRGSDDADVTLGPDGYLLRGQSLQALALRAFVEEVLPSASPVRDPVERARTLNWIALLNHDAEQTLAASEEVLSLVTRETSDIDWAVAHLHKGATLVGWEEDASTSIADLRMALHSSEAAASVIQLDYFTGCWAASRSLLANTRLQLGKRLGDQQLLLQAREQLVTDLIAQEDSVLAGHASCCEAMWEVLLGLNEALAARGVPELFPPEDDLEPLSLVESQEEDERERSDPLAGCPELPRLLPSFAGGWSAS